MAIDSVFSLTKGGVERWKTLKQQEKVAIELKSETISSVSRDRFNRTHSRSRFWPLFVQSGPGFHSFKWTYCCSQAKGTENQKYDSKKSKVFA